MEVAWTKKRIVDNIASGDSIRSWLRFYFDSGLRASSHTFAFPGNVHRVVEVQRQTFAVRRGSRSERNSYSKASRVASFARIRPEKRRTVRPSVSETTNYDSYYCCGLTGVCCSTGRGATYGTLGMFVTCPRSASAI